MHRSLDKLGRRPRHIPVSSDKDVSPKARDLDWFEFIQGHGDQTSDRLHAFTKPQYRNADASDNRLTDLFHEATTPHGGTYLTRPISQFKVIRDPEIDTKHDQRKNSAVYRNTDRARAALRDAGRLCENVRPYSNSFEHDLIGSSITADTHLACRDVGFAFRYGHDVLNAFGLTWSFEVTYEYTSPKTGKAYTNTETFRPDGIFSITYPTGKVLYLLEVDRGNEANNSDADRKTLSHNILMYRAFIGGKQYLDYFKKPIPIVVLFASTAPVRMQRTKDYLNAISHDGNNYIGFHYFDNFGIRTPEGEMLFHPADIMTDILTVPWARVGKPPITLAKPY